MQAVILAAGIGKRLRPLTEKTPKCLVEVNGKPILINTLENLESRGVDEVVLVVGYLREKVYERIGYRFGRMKISYVENPDYENTNNVYSVWLARERLDRDTILLECDTYFEGALLDVLLNDNQHQCQVLLGRFQPYMDGTVVEMNSDSIIQRLIPTRDQLPGLDFSNKFKTVNIYFFSKGFLEQYFLPHLDLYVKNQSITAYYEVIIGALIFYGTPGIHGKVIDGIKWFEIDDEADLARASYFFSSKSEKLKHINSLYGGFWRYDFLDFCYLVNLYYPPPSFMKQLQVSLPSLIGNYPSGMTEITRLIARAMNLEADMLVVGNGASEIIKILAESFVKRITIPTPTFNEYENRLKKEQITYFHMEADNFQLDPKKFVDTIFRSGSDAALLINPNNPTSMLIRKGDMEFLLDGLRDLELFIIDESFMDFTDPGEYCSVHNMLYQYPNVILVRSMSKEFGIPGMRIGYAVSSNKEYIARLRNLIPIWNINSISEHFLEEMPQYDKEYRNACDKVRRDRDALFKGLKTIPYLEPYPPAANFIFARVLEPYTSGSLMDRLFMEYSILIKDCSNKTGLKRGRYVRIASRNKDDNEKLLKALKELS